MKIHVIISSMVLGVALMACSSESISHDASKLPAKARDLISQNFNSAVSMVETEKSVGKVKEYEVILTDGVQVTFSGDGEWKSVDTPNNIPVPHGLVPTSIAEFVAQKHAGAYIVGIEKNKKGFEVELSNGVDMQFDTAGVFMKYDN